MLTIGPALAGLVTAVPALGLRTCYLADAASFAASVYGVSRLPAMSPQAGPTRPSLRSVAEGARFVRRSQLLMGAFLTDLNATVFGLPVALFPSINATRSQPVAMGGSGQLVGLPCSS
jgi:hypothetical protein